MTITDIIDILSQKDDIVLREGVTDDLIFKVEAELGIQIPKDIKQFYKFSNGLETDEYMFNIIRLEDVIENKIKWEYSQLYIAEYLIYSDMWELEIDSLNSNNYIIFKMNQLKEKSFLQNRLRNFYKEF
jgi:hypothetical protein